MAYTGRTLLDQKKNPVWLGSLSVEMGDSRCLGKRGRAMQVLCSCVERFGDG